MSFARRLTSSTLHGMLLAAALASAALLSGCGSFYVDTATKLVPLSEMKKVAQPKPVRIAFEFQTNGAPNATATDYFKKIAETEIKNSGLFSTVEAAAGPDSNVLSIILNNVPLTKDAAAQGFVTGLTFGLAGSAVTDGYICTARYLPTGKTEVIQTSAKHAIHTTIGNANPPAGAVKSASLDAAATQMTREILSNVLRDLAANPNFN